MLNKFFYNIDTSLRFRSLRWMKVLKHILEYQWFNETTRENEIIMQLNKLIHEVTAHNDFYKTQLSGIKYPIKELQEIYKIPALEKSKIRANYNELNSKINIRYKTGSTSGSTGIPLHFLIGYDAIMHQVMNFNRFLGWYNIKPYDNHVLLWGPQKIKKGTLFPKIKRIAFNYQYRINIFELNKDSFQEYFTKISVFKPVYFRSYKSGAIQFADLAKKLNINIKNLHLRLVIVTSEILFPDERKFLEESFGCKVANEYGASEIGQFAFDCPKGSLHICDDINYLLTDNENNVLVTSLYNTKFPFINYNIGDKVILSGIKCECGRTLPVIERIEGRADDFIIKPNGERLSQYAFYYLFEKISKKYGIQAIRQYKVVQKANSFKFELVTGPEYNEEAISFIKDYTLKTIGNNIEISIEFKDHLEKEKSGKLRFFQRIN